MAELHAENEEEEEEKPKEVVVNNIVRQLGVWFPDSSRIVSQGATMQETVIGLEYTAKLLGLNLPERKASFTNGNGS